MADPLHAPSNLIELPLTPVPTASSGYLLVKITKLDISVIKPIKKPLVRIRSDSRVLFEVRKDNTIKEGWAVANEPIAIWLPPGSFTITLEVYEKEPSKHSLRGARVLRVSVLIIEGMKGQDLNRNLFNLSEAVTCVVSLRMEIALRQVLNVSPDKPSGDLDNIPLLTHLHAATTHLRYIRPDVVDGEAFRCAWTVLNATFHAFRIIFRFFIDSMGPQAIPKETKRLFVNKRNDGKGNAVEELVEQLEAQLRYAALFMEKHSKLVYAPYEQYDDDKSAALSVLITDVIQVCLLIWGWADVYPDTTYHAFIKLGSFNTIAATALSAFNVLNQRLVSLRTQLHVIQNSGSPIPLVSMDRHDFCKSLLYLAINEAMLETTTHYRDILYCLRGSDVEFIFIKIDEELAECGNDPEKVPRRDALRRTLTRLAQSFGVLPRTMTIGPIQKVKDLPVGKGAHSRVSQGLWLKPSSLHGGIPVALKRLIPADEDREDKSKHLKSLLLEVISNQSLRHRHVIETFGVYLESRTDGTEETKFSWLTAYIVFPLYEKSNVRTYLARISEDPSKYPPNLVNEMVNLWLGHIAQGMEYLHSEGIVHGDLRGPNIFIDPDEQAVISDFGLAVYAEGHSKGYGSTRSGNSMWRAPEQLTRSEDHLEYRSVRPTRFTDVYTFANLCVEIYRNKDPYPGTLTPRELMEIRNGTKHPERPLNPRGTDLMDKCLWKLLSECWRVQPEFRPTAREIVERLRAAPLNYIAKDHDVTPVRRLRTTLTT